MLKALQVHLKKNHPALYSKIRSRLFGIESRRRMRKARHFVSEEVLEVKYSGFRFKIIIDPKNGFVDRTIFVNQVYEPDILSVIHKHLKAGDTFVDIGANIGQHSLFAACVVGEKGTVVAFEPIPAIVDQFSRSVSMNNLGQTIRVINAGCGSAHQTVILHTNPTNMGGSSIHVSPSGSDSSESITLITADSILQEYPKIHFIKIDTEGHEYEVIQGLEKTIVRDHPKILLEFSPSFRKDITGFDILSLLEANTYTFYDLENGHSVIDDLQTWTLNFKKIQTNLLCLPKETK